MAKSVIVCYLEDTLIINRILEPLHAIEVKARIFVTFVS